MIDIHLLDVNSLCIILHFNVLNQTSVEETSDYALFYPINLKKQNLGLSIN